MRRRPAQLIRLAVPAAITYLVFSFCWSGCHPEEKLDEKVSASTPLDLMMWRTHIARRQRPEERLELDDMLQEIGISVMVRQIASGSEAVDAAIREEIDGITLRELLRRGQGARRQRLDLERVRLQICISRNACIQTRPGDTASADYLANVREKQLERWEKLGREICGADRRLNELGGYAPRGTGTPEERLGGPRGAALTDSSQTVDNLTDESPVLITTGNGKTDTDVFGSRTWEKTQSLPVVDGASVGGKVSTARVPVVLRTSAQAAQTPGSPQEAGER